MIRSAIALIVVALAVPVGAEDPFFEDGFESGDGSAWSAHDSGPKDPLRFSALALRDPHLFVDVLIIGCSDITDDPIGPIPSINQGIAAAIEGDDDSDGVLDLNVVLVFRPFDENAIGSPVDLVAPSCSAPVATTSCGPPFTGSPASFFYDASPAGPCLGVEPGSTSGYSPAVDQPTAPCFATRPESLIVDLGGIPVPLVDGQLAARWLGDPPSSLESGLLRGFLSESAADTLILPPELPLVGGQPLSALLPGGTGNCAPGDDRDSHDGAVGWWFYFNFEAVEVPYSDL